MAKTKLDDLTVDAPKPVAPTVCRTVHYQPPLDDDTNPWAAIVTKVVPGTLKVALVIFDPNGITRYRKADIDYSEKPKPGCWSWPPYAPKPVL